MSRNRLKKFVGPCTLLCTLLIGACNSLPPLPEVKEGSLLKVTNSKDRIGDFIATTKLGDGRIVAVYHNESLGGLDVAVEKSARSRDFQTTTIKPGNSIIGLHNSVIPEGISTYEPSNHRLFFFDGDGAGNYSSTPVIVDDGNGGQEDVGQGTSLTKDRSGRLYLAYYNATLGSLWLATREHGESNWIRRQVSPSSNSDSPLKHADIGRYPSIAVNDRDTIFVAAYDSTHQDAILFVGAADETDQGDETFRWQAKYIDTEGNVGSWMNLALDRSGNPAVCYFDASPTKGDLKYRHFDAQGNPTMPPMVVDSRGVTGLDGHLKFNSRNQAQIVYLNGSHFDLNLAAQEGGQFTIRTLVSEGVVGFFPSFEFTQGDEFVVLSHLSYIMDDHGGLTEQKVVIYPPAT